MSTTSPTRRTPDQVLAELESMGEDAVRDALAAGEFASYKVPLIEGWLDQKDQDRQLSRRVREHFSRKQVEKRDEELRHAADRAADSSERAARMAAVAAVAAGAAALLSAVVLIVSLAA